MIEELFPGTGNSCAEIGEGFAVASREIDESMLRPGGFVSGPTQFGLADAALWYMVFAAAAPCSAAFVQCSTRISSRNSAFGHRSTSPAAYTPGTTAPSDPSALRVSSHTTPSRSCNPLSPSHAVAGTTPMPTTTMSASISSPPSSNTPSSWSRSTCTPHRTTTPRASCIAAMTEPISSPSPRTSGAGPPSSTVTSLPSCLAVAATSSPMKPAPITTT